MKANIITLEDFVAAAHREVDQFRSRWLKKSRMNPKDHPLIQEEPEWWSEFITEDIEESRPS